MEWATWEAERKRLQMFGQSDFIFSGNYLDLSTKFASEAPKKRVCTRYTKLAADSIGDMWQLA